MQYVLVYNGKINFTQGHFIDYVFYMNHPKFGMSVIGSKYTAYYSYVES